VTRVWACVRRGVRHGRDAGDLGRGLPAVLWERSAGQVVQVCVTVLALATFASPVRAALRIALAASAVCVIAAVLVVPILPRHGSARMARARQAVASVLRAGRRRLGVLLAGLGAAQGVATGTTYGMSTIAPHSARTLTSAPIADVQPPDATMSSTSRFAGSGGCGWLTTTRAPGRRHGERDRLPRLRRR
jgi:hypothetical protein